MKHLRVAMMATMLFPWGGSAGPTAALGAGFQEAFIPKIQCQPLLLLDTRIRYCTENFAAVNSAEECSRQVTRAWESAAPDLALISKQVSLSQQAQVGQSEAKLRSAISRLEKLLEQTSAATDQIAAYPTVMVDNPGMTSAAESLPCYGEAFMAIQQKVSRLDARLAEGRAALNETRNLQAGVRAAAQSIRSTAALAPQKLLKSSGPYNNSVSNSSGKKLRNPSSDITGIKERPKLN